jgi:hypothetical protein
MLRARRQTYTSRNLQEAPLRYLLLVVGFMLAGCADLGKTTVLEVEIATYVPESASLDRIATVKVFDIREHATLERTALSTSMGKIVFAPHETAIISELVQAEADHLLAAAGSTSRRDILVGIRILDVTTPSTAFYADMTVDIELVLRVGDEERSAKGAAVRRTWVWPTQERLQSTANAAFSDLSNSIEVALRELLFAGN